MAAMSLLRRGSNALRPSRLASSLESVLQSSMSCGCVSSREDVTPSDARSVALWSSLMASMLASVWYCLMRRLCVASSICSEGLLMVVGLGG